MASPDTHNSLQEWVLGSKPPGRLPASHSPPHPDWLFPTSRLPLTTPQLFPWWLDQVPFSEKPSLIHQHENLLLLSVGLTEIFSFIIIRSPRCRRISIICNTCKIHTINV